MELSIRDRTITNPTVRDIESAISTRPFPADWSMALARDDDTFIEAVVDDDGTFSIEAIAGKRIDTSASPIDAARLTRIFVKYLNGDRSWRKECRWTTEGEDAPPMKPVPARDMSQPPVWAVAIVAGSAALSAFLFWFLDSRPRLRASLPFGESPLFYVGLIFLPMVVLVLVAVAVKLIDVRRSATWARTSGRIIKSGIERREHKFQGEATTVTNVPAVEYEFSARGRAWRGSRIGIGDDSGGPNTEATLKRYPVGQTVTVYYDPSDPSDCVLERDIPPWLGKGCAMMAGIAVAFVLGVYFSATYATRLVETHLPNAQAPVTVFATYFGLAVLLFAVAHRRYTRQAASWPTAAGTVISSGTERIEKREKGRTHTSYAPAVEYAYRVNGIEYRSRQIKLGVTISGSQSSAERTALRYPAGSAVKVRYDPENPSTAALENAGGFAWLLAAVALCCFGLALFASGVFQ